MSLLAPRPSRNGRHLVLYDGLCGLCDRSVRFLLRIDRHAVLAFAPLQGETAARIRDRWRLPDALDSMVFVRHAGGSGEAVLTRSTGILAALDAVGGAWRALAWLRVVPRPVRDAIYDFVARRRTRWFGRLDVCRAPGPAERERFLP